MSYLAPFASYELYIFYFVHCGDRLQTSMWTYKDGSRAVRDKIQLGFEARAQLIRGFKYQRLVNFVSKMWAQ